MSLSISRFRSRKSHFPRDRRQPGVTVRVNTTATTEYLNTKVLRSAAGSQKEKEKGGCNCSK